MKVQTKNFKLFHADATSHAAKASYDHSVVLPVPEKAQTQARQILRQPAVCSCTGWSRSTLYNRVKAREFPPPIKTGPRTVGWLREDVDAYLAKQLAQRDIRVAHMNAALT